MNKNTPRRRKLIYDCACNDMTLCQANAVLFKNNEHSISNIDYDMWVRFIVPIGERNFIVKDQSIAEGADIAWVGRYMKKLYNNQTIS